MQPLVDIGQGIPRPSPNRIARPAVSRGVRTIPLRLVVSRLSLQIVADRVQKWHAASRKTELPSVPFKGR